MNFVNLPIARRSLRFRRFVVPQNPHRRRLEIVELPRAGGPGEHDDRRRREQERRREQDEHHRHGNLRVGANERDRELLAMTVKDDIGMRIAASSGLMNPVIASTTATTL